MEFALTGQIRFDRVDTDETILDKAGAFGLRLTHATGQPQLEFVVVSSGVQKRVLSPQVVADSTWYRFSAGLQGGRVQLVVGSDAIVQRGDPSGPPDTVSTSLLIGSSLSGNLQQIEAYDLTSPSLAVFANGATTTDVTFDANGEADVPIFGTGALVDPNPSGGTGTPVDPFGRSATALTATGSPAPTDPVPNAAFIGPRGVVVRFVEAPNVVDPEDQTTAQVFWAETEPRLLMCGNGLATGEDERGIAIACDMTASLTPLNEPQAVRDLLFAAKNFVKGKQHFGDYFKAVGSLVVLAVKVVPVLATVVKGVEHAGVAAHDTAVAMKTAEKGIQALEDIARTGKTGVAEEGLMRIMAGEDLLVRVALVTLETSMKDGRQGWDRLERLGKIFGHEELVKTLAAMAKRVKPSSIEKLLEALDQLGLQAGETLSAGALEGLARFLQKVPKAPAEKVVNLWRVLGRELPATRRLEVFENTFEFVRQGDLANPVGWGTFLQKGLGSVSNSTRSQIGLNAAKGAYHVLEHLAVDLRWRRSARSQNAGRGTVHRYPLGFRIGSSSSRDEESRPRREVRIQSRSREGCQ